MVPEGWVITDLGEVADFLDGKRKPLKSEDRKKIRGLYPYYGATGVIDWVNDYIFDDELILMGEDGENILSRSLPHVFQISGKTWVNNHAHVLKPKPETDIGYLTAYLESLRYERYNSGSAQPKLNKAVCEKIPVKSPPLPEQKKIAQILSTWDQAITATERLLENSQQRKKGLMQQLLTGKKRLPGFEGEWETFKISELEDLNWLKLGRGKVISKTDIENIPGDYPIYSSSVKNDGLMGAYGDFMFDEELISWSVDGGGNFFYRSRHKFSVTNVSGYMRLDTERLSYKFLAEQLTLLHERQAFNYQTKAHPSVIRKLYTVNIPSLNEQRKIAEVLATADTEIVAHEVRLDCLKHEKKALMQQLLTGKRRVNVEAEAA